MAAWVNMATQEIGRGVRRNTVRLLCPFRTYSRFYVWFLGAAASVSVYTCLVCACGRSLGLLVLPVGPMLGLFGRDRDPHSFESFRQTYLLLDTSSFTRNSTTGTLPVDY